MLSQNTQYLACLHNVAGVGNKTLQKIEQWLERHACGWSEWWWAPRYWQQAGLSEPQIQSLRKWQLQWSVNQFVEWLARNKIYVAHRDDQDYPDALLALLEPPVLLYYTAPERITTWPNKTIGVIGTRRMTSYGQKTAQQFVQELVADNWTIVSGAMTGIDATAHYAAMNNGGQTIGVLGYGFNAPNSFETQKLLEVMSETGQRLVSEYSPLTLPAPGTFVARNRIIAGLSLGIVVIEAGIPSGSFITVHEAQKMGKPVWAIPLPLSHPHAYGLRKLVDDGARLAIEAGDIMRLLGHSKIDVAHQIHHSEKGSHQSHQLGAQPVFTNEELQLLQKLRVEGGCIIDDLIPVTSLSLSHLLRILTKWELLGIINKNGPTWQITQENSRFWD